MTLIEKLSGRDNYSTWRFAVQTYLQHEDLWSCIEREDDDPVNPKLDIKAKSKIILLVDPINYVHIQEAKTAKEVWLNLAKAFDDKGLSRRVGLLKELITTTLEGCQNIEEYVNKVMSAAHKLRNISFEVNDEWLGTLLLAGLPEMYKPMIMAMESSGVPVTADSVKTKLLQEVKSSESTALYVNRNLKSKQPQKNNKSQRGPRCFSCNRYGHISKFCNSKKKEHSQNKESGYVAVFSASTSNDGGWYIDSGASSHLTMRDDWLYDITAPPISSIRIANDKMLEVKSSGKVNLNVVDKMGNVQTIQVKNVLFVPELATNLLSVSQMISNGCSVQFNEGGCTIFNKENTEVAAAKLIQNMYRLNTHSVPAYICKSNESDRYLWHQRMAHLNFGDLNKLTDCAEGVKAFKNKDSIICECCQKGKQSRLPFPTEGSRAKQPLELIHSDVCGPLEMKSLGGARYFLTFTDDYTRKVFVYFLTNKSDVFIKFKEFKALVENQLNLKIKCIRTDNAKEYLSNEFSVYLKNAGIIHQTSNPYTPQQNGLAERMNRTLMERARCMLINSNLQKQYWAEAVATAAYITNRCPTRALSYATPEELWSGKKPNLSHIKIFGCEAMVHTPKQKHQKLDPKASKMIFIGYCDTTKGYRLIDPKTKKIVISRDVVFLENSIKRSYVMVPLTESSNEQAVTTSSQTESHQTPKELDATATSTDESFYSDDEGSVYIPEKEVDSSLSYKNITLRPRNKNNIKQNTNTYLCQGGDLEHLALPQTYHEAISSADKEKWKQSIREELKAHEQNQTWQLVEKPPGKKIIGCKWVFRIKDEPSGPLFKSRLCAKGCSQSYQIDYNETFSPTVRYDSVRILLSEVCQQNLKMVQFDVKTAFLYGDISENIYMTPPEGLEAPENFVCKLNRSLYGLKQAPRCWNQKFDSVLKKFGLENSHSDKCVYTGQFNNTKVYLLLYVDDGLVISKDESILEKIIQDLKQNFQIKTCKPVNFVGLQIERYDDHIFIHQQKYIEKLLFKFNMSNANSSSIPVDPHTTLEKSKSEPDRRIPYREAVGSLMHLAIVSRPDIMYAVSLVSRYLDSFDNTHWNAVKKILKYLKETQDYGLRYSAATQNIVEGYSDADYAKDTETRKSTTGYVFIKNGAAITWASQRQQSIALSTTEAEFMAACAATKEALWIKRLLLDLDIFNQESVCLNIDNQSAISVIKNVDFHKRCKHIDIKYKFVKEKFQEQEIDLNYVCTKEQLADLFTKGLSRDRFKYLRDRIGICKVIF